MRVTAAQPLRYCRITAHHQKSRTLQSKQRRKKEKNEQPEELEAFTVNYLQLFLKKNILIYFYFISLKEFVATSIKYSYITCS